jgi:hypothetical protein
MNINNGNDNFQTDLWIKQIFDGWFDPCPLDPEWENCGLEMNWENCDVFINPPYSNPKPWVIKAVETAQWNRRAENNNTIVMLLKHDSSTEWFRLLHQAGANFLMLNGRLKHRTGKSAPFPSILAVLS